MTTTSSQVRRTLMYQDLPERPANGVGIACSDPECPDQNQYSACRGDYFLAPSTAPVLCATCGAPMMLRRVTRHWQTISPAQAGQE